MRSPATDFAPLRYSTSNLPERDRLPFWREFFARKVVLCDIEAESDLPFHAEATLLEWPGLRAMWAESYTPQRLQRTPEMVAEGDDSFALLIKQRGLMAVSQLGGVLPLGMGDAVGLLHAEPARMTTSQVDYVGLVVPRAALVPLVGDVKRVAMRLIPRDNGALRLLMSYLGILRDDAALMTPELRYCGVTHIHDLIAMALGATRDGAAITNGRGVRAARLRAIKADILENLSSPRLTVTAVALRQHVTPRYIHMLFETEGITFSEFVLGQRLTRTHRMLFDPRFADLNVSAIAFAAGFGDLSYFNRTFRRRFGAAPSELRHNFPGADHRLVPEGGAVRV
jgi:AraC-like DNA-binding protein